MASTGNRYLFGRRSAGQQSFPLQWQHCRDDVEWAQASSPVGTSQAGHAAEGRVPRTWWRWVWTGLVGLILLGVLAGTVWQQERWEAAQRTQELELAIHAEARLLPHRSVPMLNDDLEPMGMQLVHEAQQLKATEPGELVSQMDVIDLARNRAVVEVEVQSAGDGPPYRQTRVYVQTATGWTRTLPSGQDWGEARQVEGEYLLLNYYARDEEAVTAGLARADALYLALYTGIFPEMPGPAKVVINVDPTRPGGRMAQPWPEHASLVVASPAAMLLPAHLAPDDALLQSIAFALFAQLAEAAKTRYGLSVQWKPVRDGLGLWLLWQADLPLAHWRTPVVRWVFWDPEIETLPSDPSVPNFARALCEEHQLWMTTPVDIGIPIICWHFQEAEGRILAFQSPYVPPVKPVLPPLPHESGEMVALAGPTPVNGPMALAVQMATLLEYSAVTYGPEYVPELLAAMSQHYSYHTLISEVFGVSAVEFQEGWRNYLAEYPRAAW